MLKNIIKKLFCSIAETPLSAPGAGPFSKANIYVLDQLIAETKTDLKY